MRPLRTYYDSKPIAAFSLLFESPTLREFVSAPAPFGTFVFLIKPILYFWCLAGAPQAGGSRLFSTPGASSYLLPYVSNG